jgi:hypothetical protein
MRRSALIAVLCLAPLAGGCKAPRSDLVEAELRTRERELRELKAQLDQAVVVNEALERELIHRHTSGPQLQQAPHAGAPPGLRDIVFGRGTGGLDEDGVPGDEGIQVVVTPRDEDGSPVKAIGSMRIEALEVTPEGTKTPLAVWEVSALQLRRSWRAGLFSTGFHLKLGWQRPPTTERLRIVAQLAMPDGRVFEADRDITIRPLFSGPRPHDSRPIIEPPPTQILPAPQPEGPILSSLRAAELGAPLPANR